MTTDHPSSIAEALDAGIALADPTHLEIDETAPLHTFVVPQGATVQVVDVRPLLDQHALHPRRKMGLFVVRDPQSFCDYLAKHGVPWSEVWADPTRHQIVGVIDAHESHEVPAPEGSPIGYGQAGHGDHRVTLQMSMSAQWKAWLSHNGELMDRDDFAEFIEFNAADVIDPDSATMLEIAQGFHATTSANFKNAQRLSSGQVSLQYEETIDARAGEKGDLEIPTTFTIEVPVFDGGDTTTLDVRFRYRLRGGVLKVGYTLVDRPGDVQRGMFNTAAEEIERIITQPMFLGTPA